MMENKSHTTEVMQKTRLELENGLISNEEIDSAIRVGSSRGRKLSIIPQTKFNTCFLSFIGIQIQS